MQRLIEMVCASLNGAKDELVAFGEAGGIRCVKLELIVEGVKS